MAICGEIRPATVGRRKATRSYRREVWPRVHGSCCWMSRPPILMWITAWMYLLCAAHWLTDGHAVAIATHDLNAVYRFADHVALVGFGKA